MEQDIIKALQVLRSGGTILYPTDTIWGIGVMQQMQMQLRKFMRLKSAAILKHADY